MRLQPPDQLSTALMWCSAIFMAIKAGVENWPTANVALPQMSAPWLSFVPLALLSVAAARSITLSGKHHQSFADSAELLPSALSKQYCELLLAGATEIQAKDFLRPYIGRWIEMEVQVAGISHGFGKIRVQSNVTNGKSREFIWIYFSNRWEDHLKFVKVNDALRFRGRIHFPGAGKPDFIDAIPCDPFPVEAPA